jgi:hypothetical protein
VILHTPELTFHENRFFVYTISAVTQKLFVYLSATPLAGIQIMKKCNCRKINIFFKINLSSNNFLVTYNMALNDL